MMMMISTEDKKMSDNTPAWPPLGAKTITERHCVAGYDTHPKIESQRLFSVQPETIDPFAEIPEVDTPDFGA